MTLDAFFGAKAHKIQKKIASYQSQLTQQQQTRMSGQNSKENSKNRHNRKAGRHREERVYKIQKKIASRDQPDFSVVLGCIQLFTKFKRKQQAVSTYSAPSTNITGQNKIQKKIARLVVGDLVPHPLNLLLQNSKENSKKMQIVPLKLTGDTTCDKIQKKIASSSCKPPST